MFLPKLDAVSLFLIAILGVHSLYPIYYVIQCFITSGPCHVPSQNYTLVYMILPCLK